MRGTDAAADGAKRAEPHLVGMEDRVRTLGERDDARLVREGEGLAERLDFRHCLATRLKLSSRTRGCQGAEGTELVGASPAVADKF